MPPNANPPKVDAVTPVQPEPPGDTSFNKHEELVKAAQQETEQEKTQKVVTKKPKSSSGSDGPTVAILLTLIVMVLLIGLAYFAYHKSNH